MHELTGQRLSEEHFAVLVQAAAGELLNLQGQLPQKQRFNQDEKLTALVTLRTAIEALDRAMRKTA